MKLNLGCGTSPLPGYINIDIARLPGVDIVGDISDPTTFSSIANDSVTEIRMLHILEHIANPLPMFEALYRVAAPDCMLYVEVPEGSSDMAYADPQHVRQYFVSSFQFFSQTVYTRADYGYRGDWNTDVIYLELSPGLNTEDPGVNRLVAHERNHVRTLCAKLRAIKPLRSPTPDITFNPEIYYISSRI